MSSMAKFEALGGEAYELDDMGMMGEAAQGGQLPAEEGRDVVAQRVSRSANLEGGLVGKGRRGGERARQ